MITQAHIVIGCLLTIAMSALWIAATVRRLLKPLREISEHVRHGIALPSWRKPIPPAHVVK